MFRVPVRYPTAAASAISAITLAVVAALVVAACSAAAPGAPAASSSVAASTSPAAPSSAAAPGGSSTEAPAATQVPSLTGGPGETAPAGSTEPTGGTPVSADDICAQIPEAAWTVLARAFDVTLVKDPERPCNRSSEEGTVELGVDVEAGRDQIRSLNSACGTVQPVPGIGDEAIWCPSLKSLAIYANGQTTTVQVFSAGPAAIEDTAAIAAAQAFASVVLPLVPKVAAPAGNTADEPACQATNQSELQSVLGEPFSPPAPDAVAAADSSCTFERLNQIGSVAVRISQGTTNYDASHTAFAAEAVDVAGVGQRAIWVPSVRVLDTVCGANTLELQLVLLDKDAAELRPLAEALAKLVCPRVG